MSSLKSARKKTHESWIDKIDLYICLAIQILRYHTIFLLSLKQGKTTKYEYPREWRE